METFIDLCRKFPWSWKIKASYKRLVNNKDNEREIKIELEKILSRSVRYAGRSIQSPETVADLEGTIEFLEMLVLNLNAFNTELSEEFPNFDDRILPLLEKYSELLFYRSKQTGLEVECLQRMYTFLQGLSIHKDNKTSTAARTKKLLDKTTFNIKASVPAPDVSITGDKQEEINNNIETVESAPEASTTNDKEEEVNNNVETVESCSEKRVRFAETSPKRIDPVEWDAEVTPEPSPGNGHQASSSTDSGGADAATSQDERNQSDESNSNSSSTTSVRGERKKEDGETEQEESDSRYHSLEPNSTTTRQQEDSSEDEKGGSKRRYYSLEPCYSIPEEKKPKSSAIFDLSSDDEYDKESLTPLESIIESLASTPKNNEEFRRQLFANKKDERKKDADSSPFAKPAVPVHKRRILSSESSNDDGPAAKPSASEEATFLRPAVRALQLHSDSDSTMGEITLKVTSTPVIEPTRPHQIPEQVELSDARRVIPESPLKGEGSARVLAVASEITPIIASSEPFVFPGVPPTQTPAAASSPKAGSSISTASSNTVRLSLASSTTEKLSSAAPSSTSIASSTTAKLSSVTPSTSTAELSPKTTSTASSSTSKLPSSDGSTTAAELPTSSSSSSSGTVKSSSNFSVSQSPEQPKIKESALVATAKWIVENQPVVGGNSPATAAVELRPKVMKALSRSVRERRLHSSKWNVSDFKTPSPNRLVPDKTSSIENGLSHKMIPAAGTEQSPPRPVTITLNELKRSMEGNLLGCDASISDAEILEEIESSVNRSSGSDEDPSKPVDFGQEDAPGDNLALLSAFDNNTLEDSSNKKGTKPSGKGASPVEQERRRSPRLTGQPYFYVPLEITRKKEPLPGTSTSTASKRKSTAAAPDSEEIPAKKVATASKRKLTMAPSPKPIIEENSPPLIPITWEEVRKQLPPCWASLIDQHVRDMGQENNLMYREGTPTLRLKVYCPCTPHIGQSKCSE